MVFTWERPKHTTRMEKSTQAAPSHLWWQPTAGTTSEVASYPQLLLWQNSARFLFLGPLAALTDIGLRSQNCKHHSKPRAFNLHEPHNYLG